MFADNLERDECVDDGQEGLGMVQDGFGESLEVCIA